MYDLVKERNKRKKFMIRRETKSDDSGSEDEKDSESVENWGNDEKLSPKQNQDITAKMDGVDGPSFIIGLTQEELKAWEKSETLKDVEVDVDVNKRNQGLAVDDTERGEKETEDHALEESVEVPQVRKATTFEWETRSGVRKI